MALGLTLTTLFPGVLLSAALSHCVGAGMQGGIVLGVVGFLLSSIALGAFTWGRFLYTGTFGGPWSLFS